jgi:hypothetical protein
MPQMALAVGTKWFHNIKFSNSYALVIMDLVCWLDLLHKLSTSFFILISGLCMIYHNFYCKFSCYLPLTKPGLGYLYRLAFYNGHNRVGVSPPPHLRTETDPVSETSCSLVFLEYRTIYQAKKLSNSRSIKLLVRLF